MIRTREILVQKIRNWSRNWNLSWPRDRNQDFEIQKHPESIFRAPLFMIVKCFREKTHVNSSYLFWSIHQTDPKVHWQEDRRFQIRNIREISSALNSARLKLSEKFDFFFEFKKFLLYFVQNRWKLRFVEELLGKFWLEDVRHLHTENKCNSEI